MWTEIIDVVHARAHGSQHDCGGGESGRGRDLRRVVRRSPGSAPVAPRSRQASERLRGPDEEDAADVSLGKQGTDREPFCDLGVAETRGAQYPPALSVSSSAARAARVETAELDETQLPT